MNTKLEHTYTTSCRVEGRQQQRRRRHCPRGIMYIFSLYRYVIMYAYIMFLYYDVRQDAY